MLWAVCPRRISKCIHTASDFLATFESLSTRFDLPELGFMAMVAYHIWLRRNSYIFERTIEPPNCLLKCVSEAVEEFRLANTQAPGIPTLVHGFQAASWCAPSRGWIKVNWDAGLDRHQDLMGVGLIARDEEGCVKATMCYLQKYVLDPTEADAFGARLGAEFTRFMGFSSIALEGDSQKVVRRMRRDDGGCCSFGSFIVDAKEILKYVHAWDICYVPRGRNGAAHHLAKLACSKRLNKIWVDSYPSCLEGIVNADLQLSI